MEQKSMRLLMETIEEPVNVEMGGSLKPAFCESGSSPENAKTVASFKIFWLFVFSSLTTEIEENRNSKVRFRFRSFYLHLG
ncbi:hypothetical protein CWI39_0443p0010 [Hamiltosporidium magnivora]|uniref:Uncharacterized protein n=1 Tax=Hamiltosporidium magnivora TaxID=148818 RepID=A0A4Q9LGV9_9MICR|nr:hypothetical protein CWI39_0443p0010 [Hamiltosporidium magnivora]